MQYEQSEAVGGRSWSIRHEAMANITGKVTRAVSQGVSGAVLGTVLAVFSVQAQPVSSTPSVSDAGNTAESASLCQLEWHNTISLQDDVLSMDLGKETFQVKATGQLYFGIHKVKLNEAQMGALADYHAFMRDDLPFMLSRSQLIDQEVCQRVAARQAKEHEIQSLIPALKTWQTVTIIE